MTTVRDDLAAIFLIAACIVGAFIAASVLAAVGRAVLERIAA
jgi:hypothetical protein